MRTRQILLFTALAALVGHAEVLVYDGFESYECGSLADGNGGTGFAGAYQTGVGAQVRKGTLAYANGDLSVSGGSAYLSLQREISYDDTVARPLSSLTSYDTLYMSFLVRVHASSVSATDEDPFYVGFAANRSEPKNGLLYRYTSEQTGNGFGLRLNGSEYKGATDAEAEHVYLVVMKLDRLGSSYIRRISLAVDPTSATEPETWDMTKQNTGAKSSDACLVIRLLYGNNSKSRCEEGDRFDLDELRIGTTWWDVVSPCTFDKQPDPAISAEKRFWTGAGKDDSWSTAANWSPSGDLAGAALVFGADDMTAAATVNNALSSDMTVNSLTFTNNNFAPAPADATKFWHVTEIPSGRTLTVNGQDDAGYSLRVAAPYGNYGRNAEAPVEFTGGGKLAVASPGSEVRVSVTSADNVSKSRLWLSGLSETSFDVDSLRIGVGGRAFAQMKLATTGAGKNKLTARALFVGDGHDSTEPPGTADELVLGSDTTLNVDELYVAGADREFVNCICGKLYFPSGVANPTLKIRARDGVGRANFWLGGHGRGGRVSMKGGEVAAGTADFSSGSVDALFDEMILASASGCNYDGSNKGGAAIARLKFAAGTIDATSVDFVRTRYNSKTDISVNTASGTIDVAGGRFVVSRDFDMATNDAQSRQRLEATLNIAGGSVEVGGDLTVVTRLGLATNVVGEVNVSGGLLSVAGELANGMVLTNQVSASITDWTAEANVNALGGTIAVTNATGSSELRLDYGTLNLAGGKVFADNLVLTNDASVLAVTLGATPLATAEVSGALRLGGTFRATLADGVKFSRGTRWTVVKGATARTGTFVGKDLPEGYKVWCTADGVILEVSGGLSLIVR